MSSEKPPADEPRPVSRRHFLQAATALPLLGAAGCTSKPGTAETSTSLATTTTSTTVPLGTSAAGSDALAGINPQPITVLKTGKTAPGLIFLTPGPLKHYEEGPLIVDNAGHVVWFRPLKKPTISTNLQVQTYKGEPVLTWWEGVNVRPGFGRGHYEIWDNSYRRVATVEGKNGLSADLHEFVITPEGTALFTAYRIEERDLRSVGGSKHGTLLNSLFQEVDLTTGKLLFEWDSSQHIPLSQSYVSCPKKGIWDWFHINSIDVDTDGNFLISSRHLWAVFKIDRSNGSVIWALNGKESDFKLDKKAFFSWQHTVRHLPGGRMSIFDDGAGTRKTENESRGLILNVDEDTKVASMAEEYLPHPKLLSGSQGSVQVLPNNHVFVGWGAYSYFSEYSYDGSLIYNARLPKPAHSYRAYRCEWSATPATDPVAVAKRTGKKKVAISAYWNGATEVARWQVLAGTGPKSLKPIGDFAYKGYVTSMAVASADRYFSVRALNSAGQVIGGSKPITA